MPLASEHYRALRGEANITALTDTDEIARSVRKLISDTQHLTLSQISDSTARQLGSILFSHEAGLISALSTIQPPEIKWEKTKKLTMNLLFMAISLIILLATAALAWEGGKKLLAVLIALGGAFTAFSYFFPSEKPKAAIRENVNVTQLLNLVERRMEAIDRDMEAFLSLPSASGSDDDSVLQLIVKLVSMKREDNDSIPDEIMTFVTAISITRGYQLYDYTEETESFFDVMPTIRETRTIVPALLQNDRLLVRGMAIQHIDESSEAE
ncbi:MAG: hypothetical protein IJC48_06535 [Clostridia bacterium]|nr:hypothetical protein [Clostridia bacterium]MBQ4157459.1 hypothetical protein [Clostridia bacterium]